MALKITGAIVVQRPEHGNRRHPRYMQPQKSRNVDVALLIGRPFDSKAANFRAYWIYFDCGIRV